MHAGTEADSEAIVARYFAKRTDRSTRGLSAWEVSSVVRGLRAEKLICGILARLPVTDAESPLGLTSSGTYRARRSSLGYEHHDAGFGRPGWSLHGAPARVNARGSGSGVSLRAMRPARF